MDFVVGMVEGRVWVESLEIIIFWAHFIESLPIPEAVSWFIGMSRARLMNHRPKPLVFKTVSFIKTENCQKMQITSA